MGKLEKSNGGHVTDYFNFYKFLHSETVLILFFTFLVLKAKKKKKDNRCIMTGKELSFVKKLG